MAHPNSFTPTQQRIVDLLSDGDAHTLEEVRLCLLDTEADSNNVYFHINQLRQRLRARNKGIRTERINGMGYYRLVRVVPNTSFD